MKILIVSNLYFPNGIGGAEKVAKELAEGLLARGHEAVVATSSKDRQHTVTDVNGVRVHYLPVKNMYIPGEQKQRSTAVKILWHTVDTYNPFMAAALGRILDAERPDVVNTHNIQGFSVSAWRAAKKRGLPVIHTAHGVDHLCPRGMMHNGHACFDLCTECRAYALPRILMSWNVDVLTGVSNFVVEMYGRQRTFPRAKSMVIYNACNPRPCTQPPRAGGNCVLRFGFLGRLHRTKGVHYLIRSFAELPTGSAELLVAGTGTTEYESELRQIANGHPGIRWLGFVKPDDFFSQTDVLVVPSLWQDPAPLVVLEALGRGMPVIGARRGGIPELVGEGTGWIFDPEEPGSLTRTMQHALERRDELAEMSKRSVEWVSRFTAEAMMNGYLEAFSCAIERAGLSRHGHAERGESSAGLATLEHADYVERGPRPAAKKG